MRKWLGNIASWGIPGPTTLVPFVAVVVTLVTSLLSGVSPPVAILFCLAAAALGLGIAVALVWLWDRIGFHRPKLRINAGTGIEYQITAAAGKAAREFIEAQLPGDTLRQEYLVALRVREIANVKAENVTVRITAANPAPEPGVFSFPGTLKFINGKVSANLGPGDRAYVVLLGFFETAKGIVGLKGGMAPAVFSRHDHVVVEAEVLANGKRADLRYFSVSGHMAREPDGTRMPSKDPPHVIEVPSLESGTPA